MKVIPLSEFVKDPKPAIYSHWKNQSPDANCIDVTVSELQLKMERLNDVAWWSFVPWSNDLIALVGCDHNGQDKIVDYMTNRNVSLKYDPALTRDDVMISSDQVLVFEDDDIDRLLHILIKAFPENAQRVLQKGKNNG